MFSLLRLRHTCLPTSQEFSPLSIATTSDREPLNTVFALAKAKDPVLIAGSLMVVAGMISVIFTWVVLFVYHCRENQEKPSQAITWRRNDYQQYKGQVYAEISIMNRGIKNTEDAFSILRIFVAGEYIPLLFFGLNFQTRFKRVGINGKFQTHTRHFIQNGLTIGLGELIYLI